MKKATILLVSIIFMVIFNSTVIGAPANTCTANGKLKIFILSGQSNMVGFGQLKGSPGTMETYLKSNPKDYGQLVDDDGKHVVRDDVWIVNLSYKGKEQMGRLTTGYGASPEHIGPEYAFGFVVGDYFEDPVLLIKSAWGGRSLYKNFLSPNSANYPEPKADGDTGFQYYEILRHVKEITGNLKKYFPGYSGKGYEIAGFGWHQGWKDRINQDAVDAYEKNMENFIKDIRKDLGIEKLPFVIANTGMGGWDIPPTARYKKRVEKLMDAQLALADPEKYPEFKGNVGGVETRDFQRTLEESPSRQGYHWNRNWETFYLIGKGMGGAMVDLLSCKTFTNSIGMKLVWIPAGSFIMGSSQAEKGREDDESPQHKVVLTRGFYLGETEVTQHQWEKLMGPGPWVGNRNIAKGENMPAVMMTWAEAILFCEKLAIKEGRRYRLPSEAEWEYACRANTCTWFYWGDDFDERYAWSSKNSERSMHKVGTRLPNAWGLFDMGGNVWEWCSDWHGNYPTDEVTDPNGTPAGEKRVIRSGSYSNSMWDCRSAERGCVLPKTRSGNIGLRVVMQGEPPR